MNGLNWIEQQEKQTLDLLKRWSLINSWSENAAGLSLMAAALKEAFTPLADHIEEIPLPNGSALYFSKRPNASKKILLGGHMDTVYPPTSAIQTCTQVGNRLIGPGVADMKGGLAVLWLALSAFEKFSASDSLGWDVIINPDEEIGSPGSRFLWKTKAKSADFALLFEPCYPDGTLVGKRKGSMSFHLSVIGIPAHAGRDFAKGRSAIFAIAKFITDAHLRSLLYTDLSLNVAGLHSSSPLNVVAGNAVCSINIRSYLSNDLNEMYEDLKALALLIGKETETQVELSLFLAKEPKPFPQDLFNQLQSLDNQLSIRDSGGLSDGNILAEVGLPCIDTLGVIGGNLHTPDEYMEIKSMVERAKLTFRFLMKQV